MRYMAPGGGAVSTEEKGFGWGRVAQGRRALGGGEGRGREGYISKEGDGGRAAAPNRAYPSPLRSVA